MALFNYQTVMNHGQNVPVSWIIVRQHARPIPASGTGLKACTWSLNILIPGLQLNVKLSLTILTSQQLV